MNRNYYLNFNNVVKKSLLAPLDGRKSFYGKCCEMLYKNGDTALFSYDTLILVKNTAGKYRRFWGSWSATTGRHVRAFNGFNKKDYEALSVED